MVKTIKKKNESNAEMLSPTFDIVFSTPMIETEAGQADIGVEFSDPTELPTATLCSKSVLKAEDNHDLSLGDEIVQFTELETISSKDVAGCASRNIFQSAPNSANLTSDFVEATFLEDTIENHIRELDVRDHDDCGQPSSNMKPDELHQPSFGLEVTDLSDPTLSCVPAVPYSNDAASSVHDVQDNLFDVFNFDELVIGETNRRRSENMVGKAFGDQNEPYQTDFKDCVLGGSIDKEIADEQYFLQAMTARDFVVTPTCIKPCDDNHSQGNARPHFNFHNQSFTDLLKFDGLQIDNKTQQKSIFSRFLKKRECTYSHDSGVGGCVLEFASTPTEQSPISSAGGDSATVSPELTSGNGCRITECTQLSTGIAEPSIKNEGKLNGGKSAGKVSGDCVVLTEEKVSSKKTAYNEKWGVKVLKAWCGEMSIKQDFESLTPDKLNELLCRFWSEVRKTNGDYYGRNSLFNLRAMINKHLKGKPFFSHFDIVTDERFRSSNDTLEKQLKILKGIGKTITHKEAISLDDLNRMYDSGVLGVDNAIALLRKVWFEITLHFCQKGSEPQEKLTRRSFEIYHDDDYRAYVAKYGKGHNLDETRMYETGGRLCPVQSFQLYLQKLHPQQGRLFQQPRRKSTATSPMWYGKAPIGEKALQQMMANISVAANLSKRYTNHCVRTTAVGQFTKGKSHGRRAALDKPGLRVKMPVPTIKEHAYCHSYVLQNVQQVGGYGNGTSSGIIPYTSQRSRQQELCQTYPYEIYGHGIPSIPRQRNPFPQVPNDQISAQLGPYRRAYKRSATRPTPMEYSWNDEQSNYSNQQPSYNDSTQKRQRIESNSNFLSQIQAPNADSTTTEIYTEQRSANPRNNRVKFSETIIYDGGVPEVESITSEEFSVLRRIL